MDLAKNASDLKVLGLVFARQAWGRPFNTTPNVPKARLAALRAAFDATMTDAKYQADMKDKQKLELNPISGLQIEKLIIDLYNSPKEIVALAAKATSDDSATQTSDAVIPITTSKGKITKIKRGGRRVSWSGDGNKGKLRVSGRKTKITIAGKKAKRKALKVGMACSFKVKGVSAALAITC
jgi:ribosomal protein S1